MKTKERIETEIANLTIQYNDDSYKIKHEEIKGIIEALRWVLND